ncbi:MAG: hypothetical protein KGH59_04940, partial [Candidatus Micrarchaeota archaeon]|nr:hypothetical protein [Candidatus Micrarchaeota archaeon]
TAYLQIHAVRFNSLVAVPIAIFTAYTIYWIMLYVRGQAGAHGGHAGIGSMRSATGILTYGGIAVLAIGAIFSLYSVLSSAGIFLWIGTALVILGTIAWLVGGFRSGLFLLALFVAGSIYGLLQYYLPPVSNAAFVAMFVIAIIVGAADYFMRHARFAGSLGKAYWAATVLMLAVFIIALLWIDSLYAQTLTQADNINPAMIQAMQWFGANTPANAVALTLWPDGSVVEGVANRTSITDSVGSQKSWIANPFAQWLFNSSRDPQFLFKNISSQPGYLIARYTWLSETSGIYQESGLGGDTQAYGYLPFDNYGEQNNGTAEIFSFTTYQTSQVTAKLIIYNESGTNKIVSYIELPQGISPFKSVLFYNVLNASYQHVYQSSFNQTNNNTFVVEFSPIPKPNVPVNVTGAYAMNSGIAASNMFKWLFECGPNGCEWNNTAVGLKLLYVNQDSKIFQIVYNKTS